MFLIQKKENRCMIKMSDLRVCTNCSNVYSKQGGMTMENNCPLCGSDNDEKILNK